MIQSVFLFWGALPGVVVYFLRGSFTKKLLVGTVLSILQAVMLFVLGLVLAQRQPYGAEGFAVWMFVVGANILLSLGGVVFSAFLARTKQ